MDLQTTSVVKKTRRSVLGRWTFKVQEFRGPVTSGIRQPPSDASRISLLNMREPMDLQTITLLKRSRRSGWKTDVQSSVVCQKISKLFK
jgi:hypothetical protein